MTHQVDTALDRTFSEPPNVAVSATRTHCEACHEPLDPNVMHKCHGNKEWEPPVPKAVAPDLSAYKGACPAVHVDGEVCDLCGGTGEVK